MFEFRIQPGAGYQAGGRRRADLLGELGEQPVFGGGEETLLDAEFTQCDLENLEVGDLIDHGFDGAIVVVVVVVVVVVLRHGTTFPVRPQWAASSQRSGISVCKVSIIGPV